MSYVTYNKTLYRTGFRPYGQTNPWAATQLNGYSIADAVALHGLGQNRPFTSDGGWKLHGLGQNHPFSPWRLHGMEGLGDVPTGSIITYRGQWQTTNTLSAADILKAVTAALAGDGLPVLNVQTSAGVLANTKLFGIAEGGQTFTVTLQLQVAGPGFSQASDAGSIVDHEVYIATGQMPLSSSSFASSPGGASGAGPALPSTAEDWSQWLQDNAVWLGAAVLAALILPRVL